MHQTTNDLIIDVILPLDIDQMEEGIALSGNCLDRNIDRMYDILTKLVRETNFDDTEKLKTLIIGVS